jgi:flagellar motor switch protein FliM
LDGFFGGSGRATADAQAAVAPAAQRSLALLLRSLAADLTAAWAPVAPIELELVKQETNPRLVQLGAANEAVLVLKFTVEFGARSGRIDWLLPEALLAPVREALAADGGQTLVRKQEAWAPELTSALQDAESIPAPFLPRQRSVARIGGCRPATSFPSAPNRSPCSQAIPLYSGRLGVSQGRNALKIISGASTEHARFQNAAIARAVRRFSPTPAPAARGI